MLNAADEKIRLEFYGRYKIPEEMQPYADRIFTDQEIWFAAHAPERFGVQDIKKIFSDFKGADKIENLPDARSFLTEEYKRGFLNLTDETRTQWTLSSYASFMDVYVVREYEDYRKRFTKEERRRIDWAYFNASFAKRKAHPDYAPTKDEVYTLQEILDFVDQKEGPIYLNNCDCRSFAGDCGKPRLTCISYRGGINTYADRGMSIKLTKEEAKEKLREFDRQGLMHTTNGGTICNCCGDCCYLSRGREIIGSGPNWPLAHHIVRFHQESCIGCGRCVQRCWMHVFTKEGKTITADTEKCVGCGLCANTCPAGALVMEDKSYPGLKQMTQEKAIQSH